jgi:hypothetical protein
MRMSSFTLSNHCMEVLSGLALFSGLSKSEIVERAVLGISLIALGGPKRHARGPARKKTS